jgi:hypothetical protein
MVGDSGAEKPCLMGDVPPVFLLSRVCDFICVEPYSPRTEQADFDWIKRFIDFHGKRHPPGVEANLWHRGRMSDSSLVTTRTNLCPQWSAMRYVRSWPVSNLQV